VVKEMRRNKIGSECRDGGRESGGIKGCGREQGGMGEVQMVKMEEEWYERRRNEGGKGGTKKREKEEERRK